MHVLTREARHVFAPHICAMTIPVQLCHNDLNRTAFSLVSFLSALSLRKVVYKREHATIQNHKPFLRLLLVVVLFSLCQRRWAIRRAISWGYHLRDYTQPTPHFLAHLGFNVVYRSYVLFRRLSVKFHVKRNVQFFSL